MKVPNVYEILRSIKNDILIKERDISILEKDPKNDFLVQPLKIQLYNLYYIFNTTTGKIRQEKINDILS